MADHRAPAFINLLQPPLAERVNSLLSERSGLVVRPPQAGVRFLSAIGPEADELDRWYESSPAASRPPVVLVHHEDGLLRLIPGLDADFVVIVGDEALASAYTEAGAIAVEADAGAVVETLAEAYGLEPAPAASPEPYPAPASLDPFRLLAAVPPTAAAADMAERTRPASALSRRSLFPPAAGPGFQMQRLFRRIALHRRQIDSALGHRVVAQKPLMVCVVSRKGGVGKTATAAGVAAVLGEALDSLGHTAALVDANIGNPDAWGRLEVAGTAPTVREISERLLRGEAPPTPAYADTPALAVYPEARTVSDGYTPAQVERLALYLKARHAATVVDLPNRLPGLNSAEASVAASWIGMSGVVILPCTGDPAALQGVSEYLDASGMAGMPVVVAYIVPRLRQIRDATEVRAALERIRARVTSVVLIPDDDRATLALVQRVSITAASADLRAAYIRLADAVVDAAALRGGVRC